MHDSVLDFGRRMLGPGEIAGAYVLEIGALNVNGTIRSVVEPLRPELYIGVDRVKGPGVDIALGDVLPTSVFRVGGFNLVLCCEVLEHAENWRSLIHELKRLTSPQGIVLLTVRGPGFPRHEYPGDYWRFTTTQIGAAFADFEILALEDDAQHGHPGVLLTARKPWQWAACSLRDIQPERIA